MEAKEGRVDGDGDGYGINGEGEGVAIAIAGNCGNVGMWEMETTASSSVALSAVSCL